MQEPPDLGSDRWNCLHELRNSRGRGSVRLAADWRITGRGRRLHDLRHTAAHLWLEAGVSPTTVQAWLGHADLTTTQKYLHYLGTSADETALHPLNQWGDAGGTHPND